MVYHISRATKWALRPLALISTWFSGLSHTLPLATPNRVHIKPVHLISEYSDSCLLTVIIISLEHSIPSCVSIFNVSLNTDVDILSQQPGLPTTMNVMRRAPTGGVSVRNHHVLPIPFLI